MTAELMDEGSSRILPWELMQRHGLDQLGGAMSGGQCLCRDAGGRSTPLGTRRPCVRTGAGTPRAGRSTGQ